MEWPALILLASGLYALLKLSLVAARSERLTFRVLLASAVFLCLAQAAVVFAAVLPEGLAPGVAEWGHVLLLACVLGALALFVRESKPAFARFPLLYTMLPLLIVISYFMVRDTYVLKEWMLTLYQGGALAVALLMYGVYQYRRGGYGRVLGGVVLMTAAYAAYWLLPLQEVARDWSWQLLLAGGLVLLIHGYERVLPAGITALNAQSKEP